MRDGGGKLVYALCLCIRVYKTEVARTHIISTAVRLASLYVYSEGFRSFCFKER